MKFGEKISSPSRIPPRLGLANFWSGYTGIDDNDEIPDNGTTVSSHSDRANTVSNENLLVARALTIFAVATLIVIGLSSFGWIDFVWPWENVVQQETTIEIDTEDVGPARIIDITPIALDCRARIEAEVPVVGTQRTSVAGATVSTDTIRMRAIGDVDTCVAADGVEINERTDGTIGVVIDASAIEFVRPRVDAVATMDSVTTDRGIVGQLADILPYTNEDDELTPAAFAFAQTVIGGSDCMQAAFDQTTLALEEAYRQQMVDQGASADDIDVIVAGLPDFGQNDAEAPELGEFEFIEDAGTACVVVSP